MSRFTATSVVVYAILAANDYSGQPPRKATMQSDAASFRNHAAKEQAFADAAALPNVKAKHAQAAAHWTRLADLEQVREDRRAKGPPGGGRD